MDYEQIKQDLKDSATIKLLRSQNAALVLSFLHRQFKTPRQAAVTEIAQTELESKLEDYLEALRDWEQNPERYPKAPRDYLNAWCGEQWLRKTFRHRGSQAHRDEPVFTLTPATEKAIAWLEDLQQKADFVGTESRFLQIFDLLKQIKEGSTVDVEERLAQLQQERDALDRQIIEIRETGEVSTFNAIQLQERFIDANKMTRQLIADFREIEQNFRDLTRKVQEAQLIQDRRKGAVLGSVLDADQALRESDQGRSFYAFWNFLMNDSRRDELKSLIQAAYQLADLQSLTPDYPLLRRIERHLAEAGGQIIRSNQRLAEKLRQMLDERALQENRRVTELLTEVRRLALAAAAIAPDEPDFWLLEGNPQVQLAMARPLHPLQDSPNLKFELDLTPREGVDMAAEIAECVQQFYVDETKLRDRIAQALENRTQIPLLDLLHLYPVTQGLPEVVAYLAIATQSPQHQVNPEVVESVLIPSLEPDQHLKLSLPQIVFAH